VMGRFGKSWALAWPADTSAASVAASSNFFIGFLVSKLAQTCAAVRRRSSAQVPHD